MANPHIVKTPNPFTAAVNTKQARNKAIIGFSRFRPIGRVFQITAVEIVHLLTSRSVPASSLSGSKIPASASGIQSSFRKLTSPQSSEAFHQTSCLPTYFELGKLSTRKNTSLNCKLSPISVNRAVWCRIAIR